MEGRELTLNKKEQTSSPEDTALWERYDRQMLLAQIGLEGQKKLQKARVLCVGAGGLGSPVLQYLAGAGVGTIGIVDADTVSLVNLHRQVLHPERNIGKNKAESAAEVLAALNSTVTFHTYPIRLTAENIEAILLDYDFIIDAVDNFETKYLINDACVLHGKPFCHAGVIQFHGQVHTYVPGEGPCLRCIFGDIEDPKSIEKCVQVGVSGPAVGICGCIQAMEAIKYLTGAGELLTRSMYIFDAITLKSRIAKFPKAVPECRVCGPKADIRDIRIHLTPHAFSAPPAL